MSASLDAATLRRIVHAFRSSLDDHREALNRLNVYPVPADNHMTISYSKLLSEDISVQMLDLNGSVVYESKVERGYQQSFDIDTESLTNGIYLLHFVDASRGSRRIATYKVFVRH